MKNYLRFALLIIASAFFQLVTAQITKLSSNTGLLGLTLNNKPLLLSNIDNTLWTSDGTPSGTVRYTTKVVFDTSNGAAVVAGGKLYFTGVDAVHGSELWVTDGTDAGTYLVKDLAPGADSSSPTNLFVFNNQVFFFAETAAPGFELWKTDGTDAGTVMVKDISPQGDGSFGDNFFANNGILYFAFNDAVHGNELWKTDGTDAGTVLVKDINPDGDGIEDNVEFIAYGTLTLFAANDGHGSDLWKTDGTEAGTVRVVENVNDGFDVNPANFVAFNNKIYFTASSVNEGTELWVTDATAAGTGIVKDITPGSSSSSPSLDNSIIFGNHLVFTAVDSADVSYLWSTDGTTQGTVLIKDFNLGADFSIVQLLQARNNSIFNLSNNHTPPYNGKAFISTYSYSQQASQLWITDGTAAGTVLVKDGGNSTYFILGSYFYTANGLFFPRETIPAGGLELWRSDGTSNGTGLVGVVDTSAKPSFLFFDFVYNNQLYFTTYREDTTSANARDLYIVNENVALPISLYNFAATALSSKAVKLEWNTTNELNSSHFDIERSADGINFTYVDKVNAAGNTMLNQRYQYTDLQPAHLRNPVLFYRLKMIDKDGAFKYSRILAVHFNESSFEFTFSPNPVQNQLSVVVAAAGAKAIALRVIDASGKQVYQQNLSSLQTINQQNINVSAWQKGIYYIQLITDSSVNTEKFVKQ